MTTTTDAFPGYAELETDTRGVTGYLIIEPDGTTGALYSLTASDVTDPDEEASVSIPLSIDEVRELHLKLTALLLAQGGAL